MEARDLAPEIGLKMSGGWREGAKHVCRARCIVPLRKNAGGKSEGPVRKSRRAPARNKLRAGRYITCARALLGHGEVVAAVLAPAGVVILRAEGLLLAVADGLHAIVVDAEIGEVTLRRGGATVAEA